MVAVVSGTYQNSHLTPGCCERKKTSWHTTCSWLCHVLLLVGEFGTTVFGQTSNGNSTVTANQRVTLHDTSWSTRIFSSTCYDACVNGQQVLPIQWIQRFGSNGNSSPRNRVRCCNASHRHPAGYMSVIQNNHTTKDHWVFNLSEIYMLMGFMWIYCTTNMLDNHI